MGEERPKKKKEIKKMPKPNHHNTETRKETKRSQYQLLNIYHMELWGLAY